MRKAAGPPHFAGGGGKATEGSARLATWQEGPPAPRAKRGAAGAAEGAGIHFRTPSV